jgi:hypothetical protein
MKNRTKGLETAREMDARLKTLATTARAAEAELAKALLEMKRRGLFKWLGYSRVQDYAEVELDIAKGKAKELVELATKLERLPKIRDAFEAGELEWTKARAIARVATTGSEEEWFAEAKSLTSRALERRVARAKDEPVTVRIVLELSRSDAADLDLAVRKLREERGEAISTSEAIPELARRAMGSPVEKPGYQIVIHECPSCESAARDANPVSKEELAAAKVDAEILDLRGSPTGEFKHTIKPTERRAVIARDRGQCVLCGVKSWLHIHHVVRRDGDPAVLSLLCSACHKQVIHAGYVEIELKNGRREFRLADGSPVSTRGT